VTDAPLVGFMAQAKKQNKSRRTFIFISSSLDTPIKCRVSSLQM
jgi:hypothetical protein